MTPRLRRLQPLWARARPVPLVHLDRLVLRANEVLQVPREHEVNRVTVGRRARQDQLGHLDPPMVRLGPLDQRERQVSEGQPGQQGHQALQEFVELQVLQVQRGRQGRQELEELLASGDLWDLLVPRELPVPLDLRGLVALGVPLVRQVQLAHLDRPVRPAPLGPLGQSVL